MPPAAHPLVTALAAARLARLITVDTFPPIAERRERWHDWIAARHGRGWASGITCPWCVGVWVSAVCLLASRVRAARPVLEVLAVAEVAGHLASR